MQHKKLMGIVALLMCLTLVAPTVTIEAATTIYNNQTGTQDGYNYELWKDYGTTSMTLNGGGTFSCQWSNIGNALFRKGKKFDATKTYSQLGNITIDYGCNYQPNGNSYLCVYGWSKSPLVEFYIVDSWCKSAIHRRKHDLQTVLECTYKQTYERNDFRDRTF